MAQPIEAHRAGAVNTGLGGKPSTRYKQGPLLGKIVRPKAKLNGAAIPKKSGKMVDHFKNAALPEEQHLIYVYSVGVPLMTDFSLYGSPLESNLLPEEGARSLEDQLIRLEGKLGDELAVFAILDTEANAWSPRAFHSGQSMSPIGIFADQLEELVGIAENMGVDITLSERQSRLIDGAFDFREMKALSTDNNTGEDNVPEFGETETAEANPLAEINSTLQALLNKRAKA